MEKRFRIKESIGKFRSILCHQSLKKSLKQYLFKRVKNKPKKNIREKKNKNKTEL